MRKALLAATLAAGLTAANGASAVTPVQPARVCPQIIRQPVNRYADVPASIRAKLGAMADPNGRWNATDVVGPGEARLPFQHMLAAGHMGRDRWVVIYETGGFAHYWTVKVFQLTPGRGGAPVALERVSVQGAPVEKVCREAAGKLGR